MTPEASAPIYPTPNATPLTLEATFCDKAKREILRFGDAIRQANNGDERIGRRGPRNLLELLPDTFTVEDAVRVRQQQGLMILAQGAADEGVGKKMCFTIVKLTRKRLQRNIKEMYS